MRRNAFDVPHPWALIVAGIVFIIMGAVIAPTLGPPGHRSVIDPFTEFAPSSLIVIVMGAIGLWFIIQGAVTLLKRRS
jgi:membrane-bound ClpP family serine protease